jgi:hypothetical protein
MASYAYTFTSGDTVTPTKLNNARTVSEIVNADIKSDAAIAGSKLADGAITNAKVDASAAIAGTKIAPAFGSQNITVSGGDRAFTNTDNFALVFATNNTERMRIDNSGNVGIGTSAPQQRLHVLGSTANTPTFIRAQHTATGNSFDYAAVNALATGASGGIYSWATGSARGGSTWVQTDSAIPLILGTNDTERMRIDASGNVGIGTTAPQTNLDIFATGGGNRVQLRSSAITTDFGITSANDASLLYTRTNHPIVFGTNDTERMRIDASGNVLVGTTSADAKFQITQTSNGAGAIYATAAAGQNGNAFLFGIAGVCNGYQITNDGSNNIAHIWTGTGGNERMRIASNGNVGINDAAPAYHLDVNGDANVTGVWRVDDTQVVTNRRTGWAAPTGTATRTAFATSTVTTAQLAERVKALIDDLTTHGLIGA